MQMANRTVNPRRVGGALIAFALLLAQPSTASASGHFAQPSAALAGRGDYQQFWNEFRKAAIDRDFGALAALTRFPLIITGITDDTPPRKISRLMFNKYVASALGKNAGTADGLTQLDLIKKTVHLTPTPVSDAHLVGNFSFSMTSKGWRLTGISDDDL